MSKKQKILLILILTFAFLFRLTGVNHGLPQDLFGDELVHINAAFNLLEQKTLRANFDFLYVPPLLSYILAPIFGFCGVIGILIDKFQNILDYKNFVLLNWGYFLIFSRIIAALFGTATIYFLFLLAKKLFSSKIALAASIFLIFDFLHFHESSHGQIWALATFFIVAGAYFIYQLYQTCEKKH
jgi:dolichyl-phosphate-mannose--protein O-mannosyl transferase